MKRTLNCRSKLVDLSVPRVMGILNVTPDSFYDGGRLCNQNELLKKAEQYLNEGATFLDIGAQSTRPGSAEITESDELQRLLPAVESVHRQFPEAVISVDTFRPKCAQEAVMAGASIINDVFGSNPMPGMIEAVVELRTPYVAMHTQGKPSTMQQNPTYANVSREVRSALLNTAWKLNALGHADVLLDPGFGFGKTVEHNFELLYNLKALCNDGFPVLVGISRKSMITRVLKTGPNEALNGTTCLHTIALLRGASVLRVHDVRPAMEAIALIDHLPVQEKAPF